MDNNSNNSLCDIIEQDIKSFISTENFIGEEKDSYNRIIDMIKQIDECRRPVMMIEPALSFLQKLKDKHHYNLYREYSYKYTKITNKHPDILKEALSVANKFLDIAYLEEKISEQAEYPESYQTYHKLKPCIDELNLNSLDFQKMLIQALDCITQYKVEILSMDYEIFEDELIVDINLKSNFDTVREIEKNFLDNQSKYCLNNERISFDFVCFEEEILFTEDCYNKWRMENFINE